MDVRVYKNVFKRRRVVLPTWKRLRSLQSGRYSQREVSFLHRSLSKLRERQLQNRRLNSSALHYKPTSSTVEDSPQLSRDSELCGKNQFCIRYQKAGTGHTLSVSPVMIRGEPILSISALKVPLCRQRFLRLCPMYLSHTGQTKRKVEKETQVISVPGNKSLIVSVVICCMVIGMTFGIILSQKRREISLYEKRLERTVATLAERNLREKNR